SKQALIDSGKFKKPIVTPIVPAEPFYEAEEEHQYYYKRNHFHYKLYKKGSGRQQFIEKNWKNTYDKADLKNKLTDEQYYVTQENGTERPFHNEYWNHEEEGIYVDIVSGAVLFSSKDKFASDCGWPSFTKPVSNKKVTEKLDQTHGMIRTEIRNNEADLQLGNVFENEPVVAGINRYCMNYAIINFIRREDMEKESYGRYEYIFNEAKSEIRNSRRKKITLHITWDNLKTIKQVK